MPWDDWQFYFVTATALAGVAVLIRQFLPSRNSRDVSCGGCASACEQTERAPQGERLVTFPPDA